MSTSEPSMPDNADDNSEAQSGVEAADDELGLNEKVLGDASSRTTAAGGKLTTVELEDRV